jgi:hypothetical protein
MQETITKPVYKMTQEKKDQFIGIIILNYLINEGGKISILADGDYKYLEPVLIKMNAKNYITVSGGNYVPTQSGKDVLKTFMQRYLEYLKIYDVFCAVDTERGEFAFEKFYDMSEESFRRYVTQERFEDVRVAVAEFKKMDVVEIVFMSFINENRFNLVDTGWQFDITSGLIWNEIIDICNGSLSVSELNADAPEVMENIIKAGSELAINLLKKEDEMRKEEEAEQARIREEEAQNQEEIVEETVVTTEYMPQYYYQPYYCFEPYYDPYYCSPIWLLPLLLI